jgi:sigma-B regulation protein RsbU (phosphoserine phosphatase)
VSRADSLRDIAHKVDLVIEALNTGNGGGGASAALAGGSADRELVGLLQRLSATLDPAKVQQVLVEAVVAVSGADRVALLLLEDGNKLRFKTGHGLDAAALGGAELAAARGVIKQVLQEGRAQHLVGPDLAARNLGHTSGAICAPVRTGGRVGGALWVESRDTAHPLGPATAEAVVYLADQAGLSLDASLQVQKAEQDRHQVLRLKDNVAKLYAVGQALSSTLDLDELLVNIVDHVVEITRAQRGFVMLLEGDATARQLVYKVGRDARQRPIEKDQFAYSTTVANKTIADKKAHVMKDAAQSQDLSRSIEAMELQSILCAPLKEKDDVIGLVYVDSQQSNREFDSSDLEVVESLCGQASIAIVNAKLYRSAREKERLTHELNIAARLQEQLLPKKIPQIAGIEVWGFLTPALEVGGDYYDFITHEGTDRSLTIAIGDVSGKGVGAGIVMAMARSALRSIIQHERVPKTTLPIMQSLNVMLCRDIPKQMFVTLNVLLWNADERKLRYTAAGHEHLLVFRHKTGQVDKIKAGGVACGVLEKASALMKEQVLDMVPGDHLVLYTDGVTEAMDVKNQQFGMDRVLEHIRAHGRQSPRVLIETLVKAIIDFRGTAPPHDDITLVALRVT